MEFWDQITYEKKPNIPINNTVEPKVCLSLSITFSPQEIEEIIVDNQDLSVENQEYFDVDMQKLSCIFIVVNSCNSTLDPRRLVIRKCAYILSLIPNRQPFHELNRHTALSVAIDFLRKNNLNLPLTNLTQEMQMFRILDRAKSKKSDDPTLVNEVEDHLLVNIVNYDDVWI